MRPARALAAAATALALLAPALPAAAATAPPGTPLSPAATTATDGIAVSWQPPAGGTPVDHYAVIRSDAPASPRTVPADQQHLADRLAAAGGTAQPGATYSYQVEAVAADGSTSAPSTPVTATAPAAVYDGGPTQLLAVDSPTDTRIRPRSSTTYAAPADTVSLAGSARELRVSGLRSTGRAKVADTLVLRAPDGSSLAPGTYDTVAPQSTGAAGHWTLDLTGRLYACPAATGRVQLVDVRFDSDGLPSVADLDASLSCANGTDPVRLAVRVHARRAVTAEELDVPDPGDGLPVGASSSVSVTVRNTGSAPLTVGAGSLVAAAGSPVGEWALDDSACRAQPLAPGGSCAERLSVVPTAGGLRSVLLRVADSSPAGTHERLVTIHAVTPPPAPEGLTVARGRAGVVLSWSRTDVFASAATSFVISKGATPGSLSQVAVVAAADGDQWTDPQPPARAVTYSVEAVNAAGRASSTPLSVGLGRRAPGGLTVEPLARAVGVTWTPPASLDSQPVSGYLVFAGKTRGRLSLVARTPYAGVRLITPLHQRVFVAVAAVYAGRPGPRTGIASGLAGVAELDALQTTGSVDASPIAGGPPVPLTPDAGGGSDVLTGRDGRTLVVSGVAGPTGTSEVWTTTLGSGTAYSQVATPESRDASDATLSPDASTAVYTSTPADAPPSLHRIGLGSDEDVVLPGSEGLTQPSWVGVSDRLVAADGQGLVLLSGRGRTRLTTDGGQHPSVSPDGGAVAYLVDVTGSDGSVTGQALRLVALRPGAVAADLPLGGPGLLSTPRWDPTGRWLVVVRRHLDGNPGEVLKVDMRRRSVAVAPLPADPTAVTWSQPDVTPPVVRISRVPVSAATAGRIRVALEWRAADDLSGVRFVSLRARSAPIGRPLPKGFRTSATWGRLTRSPVRDAPRRGWRTCYSMSAVDWAGNRSAWTREACVAPR